MISLMLLIVVNTCQPSGMPLPVGLYKGIKIDIVLFIIVVVKSGISKTYFFQTRNVNSENLGECFMPLSEIEFYITNDMYMHEI